MRRGVKAIAEGKYRDWLTEDGLRHAEEMAERGWSDAAIALRMGVAPDTLRSWQKRYPPLAQAMKRGRKQARRNEQVEQALFKLATGHVVTLKKPVKVKEETNRPGEGKQTGESVITVQEQVYVEPKITAQMFWLKSRRPELWGQGDRTLREVEQEITPVMAAYGGMLEAPFSSRSVEETEEAGDGHD